MEAVYNQNNHTVIC